VCTSSRQPMRPAAGAPLGTWGFSPLRPPALQRFMLSPSGRATIWRVMAALHARSQGQRSPALPARASLAGPGPREPTD